MVRQFQAQNIHFIKLTYREQNVHYHGTRRNANPRRHCDVWQNMNAVGMKFRKFPAFALFIHLLLKVRE
jgi:hypothetical protein